MEFLSGFFQNVQVSLRKPHHIFSKQQKHSLHLKHTFLKNHPDVPCSLVKNGNLFCGDFSNCPKVFPFLKNRLPRNLWWWWPRLILLAGCWWPPMFGDEKKASRLASVGSRLFLHELDTNKWGDKTTWCSLKQKWLVSSKKIPAETNPLSSRLG